MFASWNGGLIGEKEKLGTQEEAREGASAKQEDSRVRHRPHQEEGQQEPEGAALAAQENEDQGQVRLV
jgi:hypothetical protein